MPDSYMVAPAARSPLSSQIAKDEHNLDFNSPEEKEAVEEVFNSALQCLSVEDRGLPFVQSMLPMLRKGIGVHHSGILPILKELVEILFQENLVKVGADDLSHYSVYVPLG